MDADSWAARLSSASKLYQAALHSRSDLLSGFEEIDEDDVREEFPCPFCSDYFDIVGLCYHIDDDHPTEARNGVCPVCAMRVGIDMVSHITLQHGNIFKIQRKRKTRKGGSFSTLSLLRRELREGNLQSLLGGSSCMVNSDNAAPDPLLSSFILPQSQSSSSVMVSSTLKNTKENVSERSLQQQSTIAAASPISVKDQEEKSRRTEFVQGLLLSTIFDKL